MANNKKNLRQCLVCREHADKSEMLRIVKTSDGKIFVDRSQSAGGRGAWVHDKAECKQKLNRKRLLNTVFKCAVDDSVYEELNG